MCHNWVDMVHESVKVIDPIAEVLFIMKLFVVILGQTLQKSIWTVMSASDVN